MPTPWHFRDASVLIRKLCVGPLENNVYVLVCARTGAALLIDPADEPDRIRHELADVAPVAIAATHGHADHVGAAALSGSLGVPFRIHPADASLAGIEADEPLVNGATIAVGRLRISVIHSPGHTPGSICLHVDDHLFSGDTLFPGGPGATSGPGSDFAAIIDSIRRLFDRFDDGTLVHPGHGLATTVGQERPHLEGWIERGY